MWRWGAWQERTCASKKKKYIITEIAEHITMQYTLLRNRRWADKLVEIDPRREREMKKVEVVIEKRKICSFPKRN